MTAHTARVPALDGIRGAAIALVFLYHVGVFGGLVIGHVGESRAGAFILALVRHGWIGVDLFFALSGFLITGILAEAKGREHYLRTFFARRALRIFPLYYLALALFALLGVSVEWSAWAYLVNVRGALAGLRSVPESLQHFWSLAVEEQFYLVWPFLVLALSRRAMMRLAVVAFVGAVLLRLALRPALPGPAEWLMPARLDGLAAGAWVALALRASIDRARAARLARTVALGAGVLLAATLTATSLRLSRGLLDFRSFSITAGAVLFAAVIGLAVLSPDGRTARAGAATPLRFLGRYSYAIYVIHQPVIVLLLRAPVFHHGAGIARYALLLVAAAGVSIAAALVSWHAWEKHFLRLKSRTAYAGAVEAAPAL